MTWGAAAGPMTVDGHEGAFAWVYRDFVGEVRSAVGDALLIVYGNAVGAGHLALAGRDAGVWVAGDAVGDVTAGQYAWVVVLGDYRGQITSGADAALASEGHGGGEVTAETVSPSVGSVTANDAVLAGWADPQVPESIRDQVTGRSGGRVRPAPGRPPGAGRRDRGGDRRVRRAESGRAG